MNLFALVFTIAFGADMPHDEVKALEVSKDECEVQRGALLREAEGHSILSTRPVKFSAKCVELR